VVVVAMLLGLNSTTRLCERRGEAETRYLLLHILLFPPSPSGAAARNAGKEEDWEPGKEDLRGNPGGRGGHLLKVRERPLVIFLEGVGTRGIIERSQRNAMF
jgi:hypothetical protein